MVIESSIVNGLNKKSLDKKRKRYEEGFKSQSQIDAQDFSSVERKLIKNVKYGISCIDTNLPLK